MRHLILGRRVCALFLALSAAAFSGTSRAAFLTVYGGPTYSQTTGGYLPTPFQLGVPFPPISSSMPITRYGDVNDAGVAVANFNQTSVPLSATQIDVRLVAVRWSASASPIELSGTSTSQATQAQAIDNAGRFAG